MRSIDLYQFYTLGEKIHPLAQIRNEQTLSEVWQVVWEAGNWLEFLWANELVGLKVSRTAVRELADEVRALIPKNLQEITKLDWDKTVGQHRALFTYRIDGLLKVFENNLAAELRVLPTYIVSRKGIYETEYLIDHAEQAFDEETRAIIPESVVKDFREAGRCLAFALPTASAFHVMRCTEGVLRLYHRLVKNLPDDAKSPEWAVCVNEIKASDGNEKVTTILDQIRSLHRNPTMHPEDFLSTKEALALFDVAKSAIAAMAGEIIQIRAKQAASSPPLPLTGVTIGRLMDQALKGKLST
jgi:hypothetical protein